MAGCCSEKGRQINGFFQPLVEFRSGGEKIEGIQYNTWRKMKLFSEQKKVLEFWSTEKCNKSKGREKDKVDKEFLLIKSVTGKCLHLEVKLRREREYLATHILFPHKHQFHCLCMQRSQRTNLLLGQNQSNYLIFSFFFPPDLSVPSQHALQIIFFLL